jgi:ABC-type transporter Mla subunit MlaD
MSAPTNHWKLGLFVVISVLVGLVAAAYIGARAFHAETVRYTSYLDEAVTGLEVGSPVTFRGVTLGNISAIDVAVDRRHVELSYDLGVEELSRLGLGAPDGEHTKIKVPADLRVQLASNGITGSKYLQLDFFPTRTNPVPVLPFRVAHNTIPATPSTMKNIEDAVVRAADAIPDLAHAMTTILEQINGLLVEVRARKLPEQVADTLEMAQRALATLDSKVQELEVKELSGEARASLAKLNTILAKADGALDQVDGPQGLMVSLKRASNKIGDVAENARDVGPELTGALVDVRDAAQALRELVSTLEHDPDMLIKGRAEVIE